MKQRKITIIFFMLLTAFIYSQKVYKSAQKSFDNLWYEEATKKYELIVKKGDSSLSIVKNLAISYYLTNRVSKATKWYDYIFSKYQEDIDVLNALRYIDALKGEGEYKKATKIFQNLPEPIKSDLIKNYKLSIENIDFESSDIKDHTYKIHNLSVNSNVSDFGATYYLDKIVYSSARDTSTFRTHQYKWNEQPYLNLYVIDTINKNQPTYLQPFSKTINSQYHEASATFSKDGNVMYFTRNNYSKKKIKRDKNGVNHLKIYRAEKVNNEWINIEEVSFNSDEYSVGHPSLSPDGKQLYFVSDMPGTLGATDIFMVDIFNDGTFSMPKNLGSKINTNGREMFPFITEEKLYFSSDGHLGLGGLDVFESTFGETYSAPLNLGKPLNSSRDDFAYIVNEETQRGYFSSNREGGNGDDDIYSFKRIELTCLQKVKGTVVNVQNGIPEDNVAVNLVDEKEVVLASTNTDINGEYVFDVVINCNENYTVKISKEGFDFAEKSFTSTAVNETVNNVLVGIKKLKNY